LAVFLSTIVFDKSWFLWQCLFCEITRGVYVKNRHISLQLIRAANEIRKQKTEGWYSIDIISDSPNNNPDLVQNAILKLVFAKLNGDGVSKLIVVLSNGDVVNLGEYPQ
jgi:hypothetical protein